MVRKRGGLKSAGAAPGSTARDACGVGAWRPMLAPTTL